MNTNTNETNTMKTRKPFETSHADIVKEVVPIAGSKVAGVTFDGTLVWYATGDALVGYDPNAVSVVKKYDLPATGGVAFDGEHLYVVSNEHILVVQPTDGHVVRKLPAPGKGDDSGLAYADGYLWVGQYRSSKIIQVDAKTGDVVKTLASDRFVTGVSCVDGQLWHGVSDGGQPPEFRRLADDGTIEEVMKVPGADRLSGIEADGKGGFWCGGGNSKLRRVRRVRG